MGGLAIFQAHIGLPTAVAEQVMTNIQISIDCAFTESETNRGMRNVTGCGLGGGTLKNRPYLCDYK